MVEKHHTSGFWPSLTDPLRQFGARVADWLAPASEAGGNQDAYKISVELPGVKEQDIHLSIQDGTLTLSGEKRTEREEQGETWYFSERQYGAFNRSFKLPPNADAQSVDAVLQDGVLRITIGKLEPKHGEGTKVAIRTS